MSNTRGVFEKEPCSGIWWIRYADESGHIRREKIGPKNMATKLYQKRKTEVLQRVKLPENFRAKPVTFAAIAQDALEYSKAHKRSYQTDSWRMEAVIEAFGNHPADAISPQELERWLADEADDRGWEPATVNRYKALISLAYRLGMENGKVKTNPARLVKRRRENNACVRWLTKEEEHLLRAEIENKHPGHLPEFEIALHTGMRRSEQYQLRWNDVDLNGRIASIPVSKNGEMRHIRLNKTAAAAFGALFARSKGQGFVFVNSSLERLCGPRHWFEPAVRDAKISGFTWHCLRHTFASRLVMAGVDLRTVQQLMGHKNIQMTCRYAHLAPEHQLAAVERLCETEDRLEEATDTRTSTEQKGAKRSVASAVQ